MAPNICVPKKPKNRTNKKNPTTKKTSLKWSSQAPPIDILGHMIRVERNLVRNRYSSWFNQSGPRKTFWEPWTPPRCVLHLPVSVQSKDSLWDDPHRGSWHWIQRGRGVLSSHPLPHDANSHIPRQLLFPQLSLWNPPEKAPLRRHLLKLGILLPIAVNSATLKS